MPFVSTAVAGFAATLGASAAVATSIGTITANLLTSVALSALSHALQPHQTTPPVGIQQNVTLGGVTPESFILGRYATAGHMVSPPYVHGTSGSTPNAYLTLIVELGGIPGQSLDGIIVAGEEIAITSTVHPDYGNALGGKYTGHAWVKHYDGTQTAADPYLVAKYSADPDRPWASSAIGTGICYAIVTLLFDRNIYSSIPSLQFIVGGIPLYDPRLDSTVGGSGTQRWSERSTWAQTVNPAVMAYNIARGIALPDGNIWGGRYGAAGLPFDNWVAAMNAGDATVTNAGGSTEPAYRAGYEVTVDQKPKDVIDELMKACAGQVAPMGDTLKVRAGGPGLPVYFFTDDDLIVTDSQQLQPFPGLSATHNAVTAKYPEPTALWQTHDAPPRYNATWEASDQGRRLIAALQFPAVPYGNQVQRLMAAYITDDRRFRRHTLSLPPDAAAIEPLDVVSWTSTANGYASKSFDVGQVVDIQMTALQQLSLREVDPSDYSWDASTMQLPDAPTSATVTNINPADYMSDIGFSVIGELRVINEQVFGALRVTIFGSNPNIEFFEVEYRAHGATAWVGVGGSSSQVYEAIGIADGAYDIRVRGVSANWTRGPWNEQRDIYVTTFGAPPSDVQNLAGNVVGEALHLTWDAVPDLDLSHYKLRYSPATTGATYANAVDLILSIPRPAVSVVCPAQTGTYFLKAVDKVGNLSNNPASFVVETNMASVLNLNVVETVTENPTFAGTSVDTVILTDGVGPLVKLASGDLWSTIDINWSTINTPWSSYGASKTYGTYQFANIVDLGAVYTSRVTAAFTVELLKYDALWSRLNVVWSGDQAMWGGSTADYDKISVAFQVSTTQTDPTLSPVWSAWQTVISSALTARAFRFRIVLTAADPTVTPVVRAASATVDMPDRTLTGSNIAFTGSHAVVFTPALKELKALGIALTGLASGDYYAITGKSASGFTITVYDSTGAVVTHSADLDYQALGYGTAS